MPLKRRADTIVRGVTIAPGRRHVICSLAGAAYAIEAGRVRHSLAVRGEPGPEVLFLGRSHPVVDLRALFGLPAFQGRDRSILVVQGDQGTAGLLVDAVASLVPIETGAIVPLPRTFGGVEREWFEGVARFGDRLVVVIRVEGVLTPRDRGIRSPATPAMPAVV